MSDSLISQNDDERLVLNKKEIAYLRSFLDAGDRGGFYIAYYNMTGSNAAILQGQISTFSSIYTGLSYADYSSQETLVIGDIDLDTLESSGAGNEILTRDHVDRLVSAIAAFDAPGSANDIVSGEVREEFDLAVGSTWQ